MAEFAGIRLADDAHEVKALGPAVAGQKGPRGSDLLGACGATASDAASKNQRYTDPEIA